MLAHQFSTLKMKIVSIVGARPQFIKAAMLSQQLARKHSEIIVHTGQHYDFRMSDIFFSDLKIPSPKYNLGIGSLPRPKMIKEIAGKLITILKSERPQIVVVYGDTNSTLAGAIAARKAGIPVAHIEAGMRSFDKNMPEEKNRVATDRISEIFLCSTKLAAHNLHKEGKRKQVHVVGDLMVDLLRQSIILAGKRSKILEKLKLRRKQYILATIHRASNTDKRSNLESILSALSVSPLPVVFPIHPRTRAAIDKFGLSKYLADKVVAIEPVSYHDSLILLKNAAKIVTDSGGMQKEAYILKVPCITAREETEWQETVDDGWNILVGPSNRKILGAISNFTPKRKQKMHYGRGDASKKIERILSRFTLS